ncbi:DUF262 domain-containing protein [Paenimyroides baculatum]|uniref:DUF262 domain-containing protein n=1 Tax=Paenimyroides baculatum TaxID=2608000 RepID=A0A5M6CEK8_9FLAO|nr:DUF262 domain-containing protein [Paenimyroides baculatum]KAA5531885.1 DUF262 domain-containing protein [Paenimyroides baculatum]
MDNQLQSISKFFTERLFRIPDYQRGYAWTEKQLKEFWNDIEQLDDAKNHYVGVLTLESVPKHITEKWEEDTWIIEKKNYETLYIVDGQQRLTTVIILIQALIESIENSQMLNYTTLGDIKKKFIYESIDNGISRSYIFGYEKDNPSYEYLKNNIFLETSIGGYSNEVTIYTHNLEKAKLFFEEKLKDLSIQQKEVIYRKITQNLLFNIYTISDDIDVFVAFETMNNRGKPLTNLELLKNRLIYLSTKLNCKEDDKKILRKIINDGWKGVYHYLGVNKDNPLNDDRFLIVHRDLFFGKEIFNEENKYKRYRYYRYHEENEDFLLEDKFNLKNITDLDPLDVVSLIKTYVESLQQSVIVWNNLNNPLLNNGFDEDEKIYLDKINRLEDRDILRLLLVVYQKKVSKSLKIKLLKKIEQISFLSFLTSWRFKIEEINFHEYSYKIYNDDVKILEFYDIVEQKINTILNHPEFIEKVIEFFNESNFYNWRGIRYFLYEYEHSLYKKSKTQKGKLDWVNFKEEKRDFITVEHIFPQTVNHDCWKKNFSSYSLKQRRILNNSLGNLLPLSKPKNSSLQNKCFKDKIDGKTEYVGFRFGSYSENEITKYTDWTPETIKERGIKLLKFMEKRWGLDFKDDEIRLKILNLDFLK